ncbi:alpha/beta fold hydrolase [Nonomuraea endophytica]|uniref:Pimeloyl-ACP methyl ester carboxylesterase n=1 Tax=Nonomuraea endophytica TaxID=714136 RepID=A0A7W7ZXB7_9ACTN|nr:alpha/beta hydrolase [Nonomuraea endophytica]MBB5075541.1 pimeloyl-ACP methyl ester carboxylesterase [Nonomuraea endophytica]
MRYKVLVTGLLLGVAVGLVARKRSSETLGGQHGRRLPVETDDGAVIDVDVRESGTPAYAVVFAHGWVLNRHSWHYQREVLPDEAMLVGYDQRGHGASTAGPAGPCSIERLAADLEAVIDAAVPPGLPIVLVGHSMGGMTIMGLAARRPELFGDRVVAVALISTSSGRLAEGLAGRTAPVLLNRLKARAALIDASPALLRAGTNWPVTRLAAFGPKARGHHVRFINKMVAATPTEVMVGYFHAILAHDKLAALQALSRVETLVMVGERDRLTTPAHARRIAAALPDATLVVAPGAGHMLGLERPELVNAALKALIRRSLGPVVAA